MHSNGRSRKEGEDDATDGLGADIQAESRHFQHAIAAMSKSVETNASKVTAEASKYAKSAQVYQKSASGHLSSMRKATDSVVDQGSREDLPTGSTPRKRVWQYTDNWELTQDRDAVIQGWKRRAAQSHDHDDGFDSDPDSSSGRQRILQPPSGDLKQPALPSVAPQPEEISEPPDPLPPPYLEADPAQRSASNAPLALATSIVPTIALPPAVSHPLQRQRWGN
ncbi:hypothetical protein BC826DRAFT_495445 [Russula brevipes]|nr:hypothetical protein BC826DRAFT_495445 [Russula brevipes]